MSLRKLRLYLLRLAFLPVIFVGIFVKPVWLAEEHVFRDFALELAGYLFLLAGLAIRIWCIFYIGGRKSIELVTEGPYSLCRNPLYFGTFLLAVGVGLSFANPFMVACVLVIVVPIHMLTVRMEERNLENLFGDDYRRYKQHVPRFWPNLSSYSSPESVPVNIRSIWRILFNAAGVLLVPWLEDLLELLHTYGIVPVLWHSPF